MRQYPHFDSLHPDSRDAQCRGMITIAQLAHERARVIVSDRRTWDWTSDGSCSDPYWSFHRAALQRRAHLDLATPSPLPA